MRAIIAAGGTAGHINPALAVAAEIKKREPDSEIIFVGRWDGMESTLVRAAGYELFGLEMHGFMRKLTIENILFNIRSVFCVLRAEIRCAELFKKFRPDAVIGCGGYVSGPVVRRAAKQHIPAVTLEQNASPGFTTKLLAKDVDIIFAASKEAAKAIGMPEKTLVTGNPIRPEFFSANREKLRREWGVGDRVCMVSFGGSLGARTINELAACLMKRYQHTGKVFHIHATGGFEANRFDEYAKAYGVDRDSKNIKIEEYINDMPDCLAAADLVICRAGALTISELEAAGRASALIPSPYVSENHQYYNAKTLVDAGAAILFEEKDLDIEKAADEIGRLLSEPQKLKLMGVNARSRAVTNTATIIYERIRALVDKNNCEQVS